MCITCNVIVSLTVLTLISYLCPFPGLAADNTQLLLAAWHHWPAYVQCILQPVQRSLSFSFFWSWSTLQDRQTVTLAIHWPMSLFVTVAWKGATTAIGRQSQAVTCLATVAKRTRISSRHASVSAFQHAALLPLPVSVRHRISVSIRPAFKAWRYTNSELGAFLHTACGFYEHSQSA